MQVILTHEQADFDAVASALGANLLHPGSFVLQPNHMNRNVRAFLNHYESELLFARFNDIPREEITEVFLVDTQSLVTIKGINSHTQIHVIDHHQKKEGFPQDWFYKNTATGACTTYFVEQLQENNGYLNVIHATLLLLGIYEDTGSLTYTNTTPQDVRAAAFLIENGASLKLASQYLNQPLSADQRLVLDELIKNINVLKIEDCSIAVSFADAPDLTDEVSSIAHKLADLYDPDALFTFIKTPAGIRLVARSTTNQINVAKIAKKFGGGGHAKAAAALIRIDDIESKTLSETVNLFIEELKQHVRPGIKVKDIMSKKPLLIQPETSAKDAYKLMRQYGYEGYPVVKDNEIKGLLIRRAVDRALSHGLNLSASKLMNAGSYKVSPEDSLTKLQQVMTDSGWGQIPVVDPHDKMVFGIVTRTDLLKTLAGVNNGGLQRKNLSREIENQLPGERISLLRAISLQAEADDQPIFVVGGFARDILLKRPSLDLDFVVEGDAIRFGKLLSTNYGGHIISHKKFGTAKWVLSEVAKQKMHTEFSNERIDTSEFPDTVDLISARTEYYTRPTALPTIKKSSIKLDLQRRDFTINTMAVRLDGSHFGDLHDYLGGLDDLRNKKIRVLHSLSFVDDPTRLLRAIRFEQRFGFPIEERTLDLISEAKVLLKDVSGDRIRHELDQILDEPKSLSMFDRMAELDLLVHIHPQIHWDYIVRSNLDSFLSSDLPKTWQFTHQLDRQVQRKIGAYIILLSGIEKIDLQSVIRRLRFKSQVQQYLLSANELLDKITQISGKNISQISHILRKFLPLAIYGVYLMIKDLNLKKILENYVLRWRYVEPITTGGTLREMGVAPGPIYREILESLRDAWLDGEICSAQDEERYLQDFFDRRNSP